MDKGLLDQSAEMFTPDGTLEIAGRGVCIGQERVRARLHAFITFYCEFDRWPNHGGVPMVRKIDGLPPDRPSTHDCEAFPEVFVPPFLYANPASGQPC